MQITGFQKRSISRQNEITDFSWQLKFSNTTGSCDIGFSGSRVCKFTFNNSKIYDNNNNFVASYTPNLTFSVSGQIGQRSYDYFIDAIPIAIENQISSGYFDYFYIKPQGVNVEFDGAVRGVIPSYGFEDASKYFYENYVVTGKIINNTPDRVFKIFSGEIAQVDSPYSISGWSTGEISKTGYIYLTSDQIGLSDSIVPINLYTNFGQITYNYYITGDYTIVPDIYLNISPDSVVVGANTPKFYDIIFSAFPSGAPLSISLEYYSGITGNIYYYKNVVKSGLTTGVSGLVTGSRVFTNYVSGIVSGLDPLTNINETGLGTGYLNSTTLFATGNVSGNFQITGYGLGQGVIELDYLASGVGFVTVTGYAPITGIILPVIGYSFAGTGDTPGVATGLVPFGSGFLFVKPTGCLSISSGLVYGVDYISGILSVPKVYDLPISYNYSILAIGYATGRNISGTVASNFLLTLEQGLYKFTKQFSGVVSGSYITTGNFNPLSGCLLDTDGYIVSGILNSSFSSTNLMDCSTQSALPTIVISGTPSIILYEGVQQSINFTDVTLLMPTGGYSSNENINYLSASGYTRTLISRSGNTSSGTGYFSRVIDGCVSDSAPFDQSKGWKEFFPTSQLTNTTGKFDSTDNYIKNIYTDFYISGSGSYVTGVGYSGFSGIDSGIIRFGITGTGLKTIALFGINIGDATDDDYNPVGRALEFYLFRNHNPFRVIGGSNYNFDNTFAYWEAEIPTNELQSWRDTAYVLDNMPTGDYALYVTSKPVYVPQVYFRNPIFSGCETSQNILIQIGITGNVRRRVWFELTQYEELNAHSGVNYSPVFLSYTNTGNPNTYYGGYFDPGDTGYYQFTIPIYNDGNFGLDKEFNIYLSNPSGCIVDPARSTSKVRIVEDDNSGLMYSGVGGIRVLSGITGCILVTPEEPPQPPQPPEPPPPYNPSTCKQNCCACSEPNATGTVTNNCGSAVVGFGPCGIVTDSGPDSEALHYAGSICVPAGYQIVPSNGGDCIVGAVAIPACTNPDPNNVPTGLFVNYGSGDPLIATECGLYHVYIEASCPHVPVGWNVTLTSMPVHPGVAPQC